MCRQDTRRRRANLIKIKNRACLAILADTFLFSVDGLEKSYSQKTLGASIAGSTIADHDNVTAGLHLLMGFNRINVPGVSEIKDKSWMMKLNRAYLTRSVYNSAKSDCTNSMSKRVPQCMHSMWITQRVGLSLILCCTMLFEWQSVNTSWWSQVWLCAALEMMPNRLTLALSSVRFLYTLTSVNL